MTTSQDTSQYTSLGAGITCIDAGYMRPGIACFYLLEQDGEYAVLETGTSHSFAALGQLLAERNIEPAQIRYIIPTHVHLDHAGGAGTMMAALPDAQLLIHPRGAQHMVDPERLVDSAIAVYGEQTFRELYGEIKPVDPKRIRQLDDGECIDLGGRRLEVRHTRGHANHHFCVWDEVSSGWFSGDMFGVSYPWFRFAGGDFLLPSTTPTQFDPDAYRTSLRLLEGYDPQRMYLTHYGELGYSAEKSALLEQQIDTYCELAALHFNDVGKLQQSLSDYSVDLLQQSAAGAPQSQLREWLAFDIELNALGLQYWQQKIAAA